MNEETNQAQKSNPRNKKVIYWVAYIVVGLVAFFGIRYLAYHGTTTLLDNNSKQETIRQAVAQVKSTTVLPKQVDSGTTWNDIKEEPGAIRYEYVIHNGDISQLTNETLKNYIAPTLCKNSDTRKLLDMDINMEYSYSVENLTQTFFFSVSKRDCL